MGPRRTGGFHGARTNMLKAERKVVDVFNDVAVPVPLNNTVSAPILLNSIAAGSDFSDRIGRKIQMKSIQIRINARLDPSDNTDIVHASHFRFIIYYDKQWNGSTLAVGNVADLLSRADSGTDREIPTLSPINLNNRDRYKILWDKTGSVDVGKQSQSIKYYKKINLETIYNSQLSGAGAIQTGALLFIHLGSHNGGTADAEFTYFHRLRFIDI